MKPSNSNKLDCTVTTTPTEDGGAIVRCQLTDALHQKIAAEAAKLDLTVAQYLKHLVSGS